MLIFKDTQKEELTDEDEASTSFSFAQRQEILEIEIGQIVVNPYQPRKQFSQDELEELAASLRSVGLIHPPVVRPAQEENKYEIISGERRFRAAQLAGFQKIPVVLRQSSANISAQAALIENIQRVDLNPLEIAQAMRNLMIQCRFTQDDLSKQMGKKRSTIANYLRLLSLPLAIQQSLTQGELTMGHAKVILSLEGEEKQMQLHDLIVREGLTVRQTEEAAIKIANKEKKQPIVYTNRDFYLEFLAEKVQRKLGTKVAIQSKGQGGRLSIDYYSLDDLDRLLTLFGIEGS